VTTVVDTELSLADQGWEVLTRNGCNACHSSDGSKLVGPSYLGGWGGTRTVVSGREELQVNVDEAYIKRSIFDPDAEVVQGFNKGQMFTYEGMVTDAEVELIIEYLKALNE
jgi:cytochrome c oxidase subunit 2